MSTKPKAPTRASTRTKTPTSTATSTRTTRATASKPVAATPPAAAPAAKKPAARKPLVSKDNTADVVAPEKPVSKPPAARKAPKSSDDADREPIMAYLRLRPQLNDEEPSSSPYLSPLSDTSVRMTDPHDPQGNPSRYRVSNLAPSSIYTFSHIFPGQTSQSDFFTKTTLPLVRDVLLGQNGLLFAYGVTNSGKTYTVQGGAQEGSAGILPRTLDVLFNSIEGLHGNGKYRPVRLQGVELADKTDSAAPPVAPEPALAEVLGQHLDASASDADIDPTVLKVDRNYEYTIWLSYAEVYNEKIYDLLDSVQENTAGGIPRSNSGKSLLLTRKALALRPSPPADSPDTTINGKYISGLRQFRVHSASQAKALVKLGQLHRRVFGTLANRESSRSHGMVILKVVRGHRGEKDDPTALQIARLTLVDLAGSERTKHTQTTGDRLKEAGNINKSLMVLGQCMEVLRSNQRKLAMSLAQDDGRMDTREVKRGLAVVPFRHSKLTEALMDYFVGDGRAVMIVNVNPYDTGYDENSHVMKFAALAREVYVTPAPAPVQRLPAAGKASGTSTKRAINDTAPKPYRRKVTISTGGPGSGRNPTEAVLEVLEEDEQDAEDSDDDEPINPLVDALFDEVEELRMQLFESEMRCAVIEADIREEVMREMEERMASMEKMYARRLMNEVQQNEMKTDAKIDMLHQSGLFGSPVKRTAPVRNSSDISEEEDVEMSLIEHGEGDLTSEDESERSRSLSLSPLAGKGKASSPAKRDMTPGVIREVRKYVPDPPMLPSDTEDAELTESEDGTVDTNSVGVSAATGSEEEEDEDEDEDEEEDWLPSAAKTPRAKPAPQRLASPSPAPRLNTQDAAKPRISKLARGMSHLTLSVADPDDSVIIVPAKKFRARQESSEYEDQEEPGTTAIKKKKRQLAKKPVLTEDQIERAIAKPDSGKNVRRMTGRF